MRNWSVLSMFRFAGLIFFRCIYSNFLNRPRNTPAFHESYHFVFQWLLSVPIVQCIWKVFTVLHIFHILLCYSLISKQYPIITMWKKCFFLSFQICIYIKKAVHKYSQPLINTLLKHLWHQLQPQILGMMRKALIIIIRQFSSILLLISSSLKLCQVGLGQMHILRFLQKYWLAQLRLWLGHTRIFTDLSMSYFCCMFRAIVLSEVLNALMSRAGFLQTWCLELRFIRPENLVFHSLQVL